MWSRLRLMPWLWVRVPTRGPGWPCNFFEVEAAVGGVEGVVAVGVEEGDDEQDDLREPVGVLTGEQVADEREAGLLALDLAGVDAVLHEHDRATAAAGLGGGSQAVPREDEQRQLAAAGAVAEVCDVQARVAERVKAGDEAHDVGVEGGLAIAGGLGAGEQHAAEFYRESGGACAASWHTRGATRRSEMEKLADHRARDP
jgi:hypothetical protein